MQAQARDKSIEIQEAEETRGWLEAGKISFSRGFGESLNRLFIQPKSPNHLFFAGLCRRRSRSGRGLTMSRQHGKQHLQSEKAVWTDRCVEGSVCQSQKGLTAELYDAGYFRDRGAAPDLQDRTTDNE